MRRRGIECECVEVVDPDSDDSEEETEADKEGENKEDDALGMALLGLEGGADSGGPAAAAGWAVFKAPG